MKNNKQKIKSIGKLLFNKAKKYNSLCCFTESFGDFCQNGYLLYEKKGAEIYIRNVKYYKQRILEK